MPIDTLGAAYKANWKLTIACGGCDLSERVDVRALLWTRGTSCLLSVLSERLKCPRCGNRSVRAMWTTPSGPAVSRDLVAVPGRYVVEQLDLRGGVVERLERDRFDSAVATWERQVSRHKAGTVIMRDGARVVRQWPERDT